MWLALGVGALAIAVLPGLLLTRRFACSIFERTVLSVATSLAVILPIFTVMGLFGALGPTSSIIAVTVVLTLTWYLPLTPRDGEQEASDQEGRPAAQESEALH